MLIRRHKTTEDVAEKTSDQTNVKPAPKKAPAKRKTSQK